MTEVLTPRLRLVAAGPELWRIEPAALGQALGCRVPASWPFEHAGEHREDFARMAAESPGWQAWMWVTRDGDLVGDGGFAGPPEDGGVVIGYEVDEARWNQGIATEAVAGLCTWAFEDVSVGFVEAFTLADGVASQKVLEKVGFRRSETSPEGHQGFTLTRADAG